MINSSTKYQCYSNEILYSVNTSHFSLNVYGTMNDNTTSYSIYIPVLQFTSDGLQLNVIHNAGLSSLWIRVYAID